MLLHEKKLFDVQVSYHSNDLDNDMEKDNQVNLCDDTLHGVQDCFVQDNLDLLSIWEHCDAHEQDTVRQPVFDIVH
jgi:uncharacterized protein with ParB-like and HNH nuclease domain